MSTKASNESNAITRNIWIRLSARIDRLGMQHTLTILLAHKTTLSSRRSNSTAWISVAKPHFLEMQEECIDVCIAERTLNHKCQNVKSANVQCKNRISHVFNNFLVTQGHSWISQLPGIVTISICAISVISKDTKTDMKLCKIDSILTWTETCLSCSHGYTFTVIYTTQSQPTVKPGVKFRFKFLHSHREVSTKLNN